MHWRSPGSLRLGWLTPFFLLAIVLPPCLSASVLSDAAQQLARKIAATTGPGTILLDVVNRSSLDERSVRDVRFALEAQLRAESVRVAKADPGALSVQVTLSESLREYVWSAEIASTPGEPKYDRPTDDKADEKKVVFVSLPRSQTGLAPAATPIVVRKVLLFAQEQPLLDAALVDMSGVARLLLLTDTQVAVYHQQAGRWEMEAALPIARTRNFPRDLRGRLLLRRDHVFDVYLPGTFCQSNATPPLTLACSDSDDPWPLTPDEGSMRAFFAPARNFFIGTLSPAIGKISDAPSFFSAAALPRSGYSLWVFAAVDGSTHLIDGTLDQTLRDAHWGSDLATVHSNCGGGTQLLVSEQSGSGGDRDSLRAFEIPEREPVAVGSALEFEGPITALWTESGGGSAIAIVKRQDTGGYEAYRVSISCGL